MAPINRSREVQRVSAVGESEADNDQQREQQDAILFAVYVNYVRGFASKRTKMEPSSGCS